MKSSESQITTIVDSENDLVRLVSQKYEIKSNDLLYIVISYFNYVRDDLNIETSNNQILLVKQYYLVDNDEQIRNDQQRLFDVQCEQFFKKIPPFLTIENDLTLQKDLDRAIKQIPFQIL